MTNRCAYLDKEHHFTIVNENIPEVGNDEVLIKIAYNGICGSDIHFFKEGRLGNYLVEEPYVPGHECSGVVCGVGSEVKSVAVGDEVVIEPGIPCGRCELCRTGRYNQCLDVKFLSVPGINGTFCDYVTVRYDAVHKIPEGMDLEIAALVEPAAVAVHAIHRCGDVCGKTGVIFGAGPIGILTVQAFKAAGGKEVIVVDLSEKRLELAKSVGADKTINPRTYTGSMENLGECVIETAGSPITTAQLFDAAKTAGVVVQVGWPSGNMVNMNIATMIEKELDYRGLNRYANAYPTALAWLADGRINGQAMITHRFSLDEIEEAFKYTAEHPEEVMKTIVKS